MYTILITGKTRMRFYAPSFCYLSHRNFPRLILQTVYPFKDGLIASFYRIITPHDSGCMILDICKACIAPCHRKMYIW